MPNLEIKNLVKNELEFNLHLLQGFGLTLVRSSVTSILVGRTSMKMVLTSPADE